MDVYVPSAGTDWLAELAVLSGRRHSSLPVDFTIGGSAGTEARTLGHLSANVEIVEGAPHAYWLDRWVADSRSRYAVFIDSDVFFTRSCWLSPLIRELEAGAALVSCDIWDRAAGVVEPVRGAVTTAMPRPAPWVMAVDVQAVRATGTSFAYANTTLASGEILAWDVGGKVLEALTDVGLPVKAMPASYARCFTHVGGMSWRAAPGVRSEAKRWLRLQHARTLLRYERVRAG